ncbi:serine protease [Streptomyces sp. R33]|uniref:Serine protease n=1 Tax=Streptomyces sp. R33 TaxID=3238629 RepID=A0AB39YLE5_9ACTN
MAAAPPGIPTGVHFDGLPMVGTFFFDGKPVGGNSTYCTGSVVRSQGKNLVLTAGHCANGLLDASHRIFVPQYHQGRSAANQPAGIFPVAAIYRDPRYPRNETTKSYLSDLDFSFVTLTPNDRGSAENLTGALTFTPTPTYENNVRVVGYPSSNSVNPKHQAITCDVPTSRLYPFRQMKMECGGYYGGVSGSPWIKDYDAKTRTGQVIGNVGGYNGGGNDAEAHWVSYSPIYGKDAQDLYNDANNGVDPSAVKRPNPYQAPTDGPVLPGSGETWKHAKQISAGNFSGTGHSDLLVIWTDGEVTLYPGDGNGGFRPERQLLAPNAGWKPVATITAGDFTGSNQFDLMVRWDDGRMTLHGDVGSNGLGAGVEMAPPGSIWSHATQIAAGRFNAATYVTDLMVRWSDGELSLFTNVGAGTLGQEYKLKDPNSTWKEATLLTSGQFSGNQKWDLMVRWDSGALNNYVGTTTGGLGSEQPIHGPNKTWTHSVIMTTGQFTSDGLTNDLMIRWTDGETTLYQDTRMNSLGTERMISPPA